MMTQWAADSATDVAGVGGEGMVRVDPKNNALQTFSNLSGWHDASMFLHAFPRCKLMLYQAEHKSGSGSAATERLI